MDELDHMNVPHTVDVYTHVLADAKSEAITKKHGTSSLSLH